MAEKICKHTTLWFFLVCFVFSIYFTWWVFSPFFSIIVLAVVITGIFFPIYDFICTKFGVMDFIASFVTCLLIFLIIFLPSAFFIGVMTQEVLDLVQLAKSVELTVLMNKLWNGTDILERVNSFLDNFGIIVSANELNMTFSRIGKLVGLVLYDQARLIASNALSLIINSLLMLLVIFFMLVDGKKFIQFIIDLSPLPNEQDEKLIGKFSDMAGAILIGNGLCGIIQGFVGGLIFWCFGVPSVLLWGITMAFLAFLPVIGVGIVFLPTIAYFLLKGRIISSILMFLLYILLSIGVEYILKPKVVGHRVKIHTLIVFLSLLGGLKVFGILGIIYGPLITTAFLTLTNIYIVDYRNSDYF